VAAKFVKCPKSYYTEQFEKYGYIRDKYDTTYNTPTPYDPSLVLSHSQFVRVCVKGVPTRRSRRLTLALQLHVSPFPDGSLQSLQASPGCESVHKGCP